MDFSPYYHIISLFLLFITTLSFGFFFTQTKSSNSKITGPQNTLPPGPRNTLPPGPPGWPVVGNLFQVANSGKPFFQYVRELIPKYGSIFTLKMGSRTLIIISSAELVHEALIEKGQVFATRPAETPTRGIFSCNKFTVNAAIYGPVWRSLRKNMVQNGLSSSRLKEFKGVRDVALDKFIERIKTEAEKDPNGVVYVLKNARFAVFCILLSMCFGVEMSEETVEKIDHTLKEVLLILNPRIDDFLPILSIFFSKQQKKALEVRRKQIETLRPFIEQRRAILRAGLASYPTAAPFSYLDTLFELQVEGRNSGPTEPEIVTLCSEFINGGTDTTATAVEWAMARLIESPAMQEKMYDEIRSKVGPRPVAEGDVDNMPYLNAFVKELLRKHPPTYFSLTHAVTEPAILGGYRIPTGCNVDLFLPGISEDPKLWKNPERFDPERFLSGGEDADITGVREVKMIPFGAGRRVCPGLSMATIHVNLLIARLVQQFEWRAFPENSKVDFSEKFEFTVIMKNPLKAKIIPRV